MLNIGEEVKIIIIGAAGMLGNALIRFLSQNPGFNVKGTVRGSLPSVFLSSNLKQKIFPNIDVANIETITELFCIFKPDIVINCVGIVKQLELSDDPLVSIPINSLFPHKLAKLCATINSRLIHFSTDCIYSGSTGMYIESNTPDARDLYGLSKLMGELDCKNVITLRTSIIGHELNGSRSLIDWFLTQEKQVSGYSQAIFSGLPTVEMAQIILDHVIPSNNLTGIYHVSANPINKYELLKLVAKEYKKDIEIIEDTSLKIDRSLDSSRFRVATGYNPPSWPDLIVKMKNFGKFN